MNKLIEWVQDSYLGLTIVALVFLSITAHIYMQSELTLANRRLEVQQLCDRSHATTNHPDGGLEESCGKLQDKYHAEYVCNSYKPDAVCWVEIN